VYKQTLRSVKLTGKKGQKTELTGKGPLRRRRSALDCSATEEEEENGRVVKLTTHLHLVPRLRMSGAIPLLPQLLLYSFLSSTGKTFIFHSLPYTVPCVSLHCLASAADGYGTVKKGFRKQGGEDTRGKISN
jgi:hypothetical protein